MTDATRSLQTRLLAEFADEPDGQRLLFEKMKEIYGHFKLAKRLPGLAKDVAALLEGTERFVNGSPQHLESIAEGFANGSRFQKAATIFSLAAGIYGTANALSDGRYLEALKKGLGTSEAGLELTAGLLNAYSSAAGASSDAAKFLGRFAPALGMVLDAIQLGEDLNELRNDPNAGELVKAVGTLLQLGGDIAGYVPVAGTLVDGILTVGGSLIHAIGDFVDSIIEGNEERDALRREQAELLATATGMPAELAGELVRSSSTTFQRLRAMGFGPAEIRALATDPKVDLSSDEFGYALKTAALFGLSPEDTKAFLELTLHRGEFGYAGTPLTQVVLPLDQPQGDWTLRNTPEGQQEYLQFVQNDVLASFSGYGDIVEFLRTHRGTPDWDTVGIDTPFDV